MLLPHSMILHAETLVLWIYHTLHVLMMLFGGLCYCQVGNDNLRWVNDDHMWVSECEGHDE